MADEKQNQSPGEGGDKEPVVYASPVKRAWAWVGVVYMVIITLLVTYSFAKGQFLVGIGSLMLCPALGGLAATAILRYRAGEGKGGLPVCMVMVAVCLVLIVLNLMMGIPALIANF